jgi:hypothetical protein
VLVDRPAVLTLPPSIGALQDMKQPGHGGQRSGSRAGRVGSFVPTTVPEVVFFDRVTPALLPALILQDAAFGCSGATH